MTARTREELLEAARVRVWDLLSVSELSNSHGIDQDAIRRAAPGPLSPAAARLASTLASATLGQIEIISRLLVGCYSEEAIANLEAEVSRLLAPRPRARARRPRPAAAPLVIIPDLSPQAHPGLALEPPATGPEGDLQ